MIKAVLLSICYLWLSVYFGAVISEKNDEIDRITDIVTNTYLVPLDHFTPTDHRQVELVRLECCGKLDNLSTIRFFLNRYTSQTTSFTKAVIRFSFTSMTEQEFVGLHLV